MFKISVYGKGGVGKSSVSSNLSYLVSLSGRKVLHVGCDPKHDSTRLLTNGVSQRTFMDSMIDGTEDGIIERGSNGISCIECGGAEPGIGCAGKGMISMFNYIEANTPDDTDVRICDVLGDVVCGGFSVPMRRKQTDGIILVVSEDFMSIYAANNILRGIRNLNNSECIIGMVLNSRSPEDRIRVEEFSKATKIPIIGTISKSTAFSEAEASGKTVCELLPDSESAAELREFADNVIRAIDGGAPGHRASPLNENAMTQIAARQQVTDFEPPKVRLKCRFDTVDRERGLKYKGDQAMPACTSHGAVELLLSIKDAAVVLHGPRNCSFLMEYAWQRRSNLMFNGRRECLPDNIYSTSMDGSAVFTGDRTILADTIRRAIDDGFKTVFVVLTCSPDTIGTDVASIINGIGRPDIDIIAVEPDEYFLGSRFGAYTGGLRAMSSLIDWSLPVEKGKTALLSFQPNYISETRNREIISELLSKFGLDLGPIFTDNISVEEIRTLSTCEHFIKLGFGPFSEKIPRIILPEGRESVMMDPPIMLSGIREWCTKLAEITGDAARGDEVYLEYRTAFESAVSELRPRFEGRRIGFYQRKYAYIDQFIDIMKDMGAEVVARIQFPTHFEDPFARESQYKDIPEYDDVELCHLAELIDELGLDLILSGDPRTGRVGRPWTSMGSRFLGLDGLLEWVHRMDNCFGLRSSMTWKERRT